MATVRIGPHLLALLLAAGSPALGVAQRPPTPRPDRCYLPSYSAALGIDSLSFAATLWLQADTNRGGIYSRGFTADTINFWRMFIEDARWVQRNDTLQLQFSNGFTYVRYDLRVLGDSLVGHATIHFDMRDPNHPDLSVSVVARPTRCPPRRAEARYR